MWRHAGLQEPGPKRQLNIALGILLPAPILEQEDDQDHNAAAYHQLLRLSVCPSAAFGQTGHGPSILHPGLQRSFDAAENNGAGTIWDTHLALLQQQALKSALARGVTCIVITPLQDWLPQRGSSPPSSTLHSSAHWVQVRELALAAGEAELQELYLAVPGLLSERRDDTAAACALLQVCRRRF